MSKGDEFSDVDVSEDPDHEKTLPPNPSRERHLDSTVRKRRGCQGKPEDDSGDQGPSTVRKRRGSQGKPEDDSGDQGPRSRRKNGKGEDHRVREKPSSSSEREESETDNIASGDDPWSYHKCMKFFKEDVIALLKEWYLYIIILLAFCVLSSILGALLYFSLTRPPIGSTDQLLQTIKELEKKHAEVEEELKAKNRELERTILKISEGKADKNDFKRPQSDYVLKDVLNDTIGNKITENNNKMEKELLETRNREKEETDKTIADAKADVNTLNGHFIKLNESLAGLKTRMDTDFPDFKQGIQKSLDKLSNSFENIQEVIKENERLRSDFAKLEESNRKMDKTMRALQLDQETVENFIKETILKNLFNKESLIMVIVVIVFILIILIVVTYKIASSQQGGGGGVNVIPGTRLTYDPGLTTAGKILRQVRPKQLERGVCLISFYQETQDFHCQILGQALDIGSLHQEKYYIRNHEAILQMPSLRLFVLFVDFNERHVILEEPRLGLGDLRLTTVRAAWQMGGKVIVIYVKDPGSRQLKDHHLYNPHLASVTTQQELSVLNREERVLSTYDRLNDNQVDKLKWLIGQDVQV